MNKKTAGLVFVLIALLVLVGRVALPLSADSEPKRYVARLSQSGTNAPTAQVLENTVGNIVWTRLSDGVYMGTLDEAFPLDKTVVWGTRTWFNGGPEEGKSAFAFTSESQAPDHVIVTTNTVDIICLCVVEQASVLTDADVLPIEIVVYP